jgi:hypothetical protein
VRKNQDPKLAPDLLANLSGRLDKRLVMPALICGVKEIYIALRVDNKTERKKLFGGDIAFISIKLPKLWFYVSVLCGNLGYFLVSQVLRGIGIYQQSQ